MLYQKKRKKLTECDNITKTNQDSTLNSDRIKSTQKISSLSKTKKKSFTKIINKRTFNTEVSQNQTQKQSFLNSICVTTPNFPQTTANYNHDQLKISSHQDLQTCKYDLNQLNLKKSNSNSICSLQLNTLQRNGNNSSRKKFKLYCELKRKKQTKKPQQEKQIQKNYASSTASQSWMKNSIFSKNSQRNESNSTNKSNNNLRVNSRKKINLAQKIKLIKNKQKYQSHIQEKPQIPNLNLKHFSEYEEKVQTNNCNLKLISQESIAKQSQKSSKRSKNSQQKKQSTVNIKRSIILEKLAAQKSSKNPQTNIQINTPLNQKKVQNVKAIKNQTQKKYLKIQNRILPEDSQIIQESVKKLSQIRQQKNQDTISRSLKTHQFNSMDQSNSKNTSQTLMHLSINSICRDRRRSFNCILQTTQLRQSALRKQIQSSLSQLQKSRQKINIQKFKQPKNIQEMMGSSQLSAVQQNLSIIEKIQFHIEIINTLSNFVYKSTELQYLMQDWDELNFLIYKKFYLQRTKVLHFLKKYPIKNPFVIKRASIETKQILKALKQNQSDIKRIKQNLEKQNISIKKNLQVFFAQFQKDKHGQKINLFEYDNFSHWIFKQLWDQIQLFSYSQSHNQLELEDRICKSLQAGFLISQLNGNYVTPFQDAEIACNHNKRKTYIEDNLKIFERYVLNKKK